MTAVTERKRTKPEERAYSELRDLLIEIETAELEQWNKYRALKARMLPPEWHRIEREVPVRPRKLRVTMTCDEDLAKWFRAMGHGYQARMNAVLRAYMLAVKGREIASRQDKDWKGDEI
jgi:uncharacterized protein (DUF4415 family)